MTQEAAAHDAGLDYKHYQALESGQSNVTFASLMGSNVTFASLMGIARALGVRLVDLFEGV